MDFRIVVSETMPKDTILLVSTPPKDRYFATAEEMAEWMVENARVARIVNVGEEPK